MFKLNLSKPIIIVIIIILVVIVSVLVLRQKSQVEPPEATSPVIEEPPGEESNSESSLHKVGSSKKMAEVVPMEIRGQILETISAAFEEELKENPEIYQGRISSNDIIYADEVDLQGDGIQEYIVFPEVLNWRSLRGASGNGLIYVLSEERGEWRVVSTLSGNVVRKSGEKTNGYYNLSTSWRLGAGEYMIDDYIWNGEEYKYVSKESQE